MGGDKGQGAIAGGNARGKGRGQPRRGCRGRGRGKVGNPPGGRGEGGRCNTPGKGPPKDDAISGIIGTPEGQETMMPFQASSLGPGVNPRARRPLKLSIILK